MTPLTSNDRLREIATILSNAILRIEAAKAAEIETAENKISETESEIGLDFSCNLSVTVDRL